MVINSLVNRLSVIVISLFFLIFVDDSSAAESDIRNTKHNFSKNTTNSVKASTESQVCVFCHTPHGATAEPAAPLWNRKLSPQASYDMYDSLSLEPNDMSPVPGGSSKLCLSCHDGTLAIGSVNVANGQENVLVTMQGVQGDGSMPVGEGITTGFTRNLGTDLSNDHPISFTFDSALATSDGELRDPNVVSHVGDNMPGDHALFPTQNGQLQCTTCHDPHLFDASDPNRKFLRGNRLQKVTPAGGNFSEANDQICIACHDKSGQAWAMSVHANSTDANETYDNTAAGLRDFPDNTQVWQAGCLNCHDTHTVSGSRRLLREGVDSAQNGVTVAKTAGGSAIEETCYQCHRPQAQSVLTSSNNNVPDIHTDFTTGKHMPITNAEQQHNDPQNPEIHDISSRDFEETAENIGNGALNINNRHVECTDCHNPHRVIKDPLFSGAGKKASGTHDHSSGHSNIASGALKGSFGVEPVYGDTTWQSDPAKADALISFPAGTAIKKGVPNPGAVDSVGSSYVTREYQVCLRCHSNYGFGKFPPSLGDSGGGTASGANGVTTLTNQAMEFYAPASHQGEGTGGGIYNPDTSAPWASNNHRSWHPVMQPTGRTRTVRSMNNNNKGDFGNAAWKSPWNGDANVGIQTMYCSDCHGNNTASGTTTPSAGKAWGPHGSSNDFILKGDWDITDTRNTAKLCYRCHSNTYASGSPDTGFNDNDDKGNLHQYHRGKSSEYRCNTCHVILPHGWKNKALLVNLNDVGTECSSQTGTIANSTIRSDGFTCYPYYYKSRLKVSTWRKSGAWTAGSCQGRSWMENNCGG